MSVVIDATAGGASANSFVTLAEAQAYMDARLNGDTWTAASTDTQNRALVEATRDISNKDFGGRRVTVTQSLSWPRWGALDPDQPYGWLFDSTIVPTRVKNATCELAFQFVNYGTTDLATYDPNAGVIEKTVDVLTTRWQPFARPQGLTRFPRVLDYIRPLLVSSGATIRSVRG